jgi:DNA-binding NtrC family response regulator
LTSVPRRARKKIIEPITRNSATATQETGVASILLIDDDDSLRNYLCKELKERGHAVEALDSAEDGYERLTEYQFDVVVLDNKMPRFSGLDFLEQIRADGIEVPVILMTASPTTKTAIEAEQRGAFEYVVKPADRQALVTRLESEIEAELQRARDSAGLPNVRFAPWDTSESLGEHVLVGNSEPMQKVCSLIARYAKSSHSVLILGETGTGKELVARALHDFSPRRDKPFVAVNTGAITATLAESHLFGHRKGAFTGADRDHVGCFERANGGTLFLDEIGDMPWELQVKFLRVLQEGCFERVGGPEIKADVRVLAATHCDLAQMVRDKTFRDDLYSRLNCFDIRLPPLRERLEDLPELIHCFLEQEAVRTGRRLEIAEVTLARLLTFHWPRNVRQLKHMIAKAIALCHGSQLLPHHFEFPTDGAKPDAGTGSTTSGAKSAGDTKEDAIAGLRKAIAWALKTGGPHVWDDLHELLGCELAKAAWEQCGNNTTAAAKRVGAARGTLIKFLKEDDSKE